MMKRIGLLLYGLLLTISVFGCKDAAPSPVIDVFQTPDIVATAQATEEQPQPGATPEDTDPYEGIEVLEFAEEYPNIACEVEQLGVLVEVSESSVTFDEALWLTRNELPADYAGDYAVRLTGNTVTLAIDQYSQFWVLWDSHSYQPARISAADFGTYCDLTQGIVCHFYSNNGVLVMLSEQYTA